MGIVLTGGTWLNVETGTWQQEDLFIEDGRIQKIAANLSQDENVSKGSHDWIDITGKRIVPGFIDMHVHLREPGYEYKETIESGTKAAAAGGFTLVACMPNTRPSLDSTERIRLIHEITDREGSCRVLPYGAITQGQRGEELTDFEAMKEIGVAGFTDDGVGVQEAGMMRRAMEKAAALGLPIVIHAEDESLSGKGCMNEGEVSQRLGLPGIPGEAESVQIARDAILAANTGAHLHVCHISDAMSVEVVRWAKSIGIRVTAEVTPHHLLLTDESIDGTDANWKVNPPLRAEQDRKACLEGLLDGTIDMIATDHAPHSVEEKQRAFQTAPFGFVGLEIVFPILYTELVEKGILSLEQLVRNMSTTPAKVFGLDGGVIQEGAVADLTVLDLDQEKKVEPDAFFSKGRNTPFAGKVLNGWPMLTLMDGKVTYRA